MRDMNYEVRNEEIEKKLKDIGRKVIDSLPEGWGFALHIFSYGEEGTMMFMSSAKRGDYINMLREFISHHEEQ